MISVKGSGVFGWLGFATSK